MTTLISTILYSYLTFASVHAPVQAPADLQSAGQILQQIANPLERIGANLWPTDFKSVGAGFAGNTCQQIANLLERDPIKREPQERDLLKQDQLERDLLEREPETVTIST